MAISRSIVEAVRSLDPPGRFLEKNPETGLWSDIGDRKAIEKVRLLICGVALPGCPQLTHVSMFSRLLKRFATAPLR